MLLRTKFPPAAQHLRRLDWCFVFRRSIFCQWLKLGTVTFSSTHKHHSYTTVRPWSCTAELRSKVAKKNEARRRGPVKILCHPVLTWTLCYLGWHPGFSVKISVILWEAFTDRPTSCRHLFLSALPDVIIIRDPEWTFVAHGPVFR